jgi:hypothetical protein
MDQSQSRARVRAPANCVRLGLNSVQACAGDRGGGRGEVRWPSLGNATVRPYNLQGGSPGSGSSEHNSVHMPHAANNGPHHLVEKKHVVDSSRMPDLPTLNRRLPALNSAQATLDRSRLEPTGAEASAGDAASDGAPGVPAVPQRSVTGFAATPRTQPGLCA